jgi:hypothetical protein
MDPFIEGCGLWEDFHNHLIETIFVSLADTLPARYLVRTGERGYVVLEQENGEKKHPFIPDVTVVSTGSAPGSAVAAVAEPSSDQGSQTLRAFIEEEFRETFVEIREAGSDNLVTCIEVLSPSNKRPNTEGWDLYQRKRQGLLRGRTASLVEVDLLRGGHRMPMADRWPESPYTILVARAAQSPICQVWPAYALRRLSPVPVPLLKPDADVSVDLQPMVELIYARARYGRSIDYARAIQPPLSGDEAAWLATHTPARDAGQ